MKSVKCKQIIEDEKTHKKIEDEIIFLMRALSKCNMLRLLFFAQGLSKNGSINDK